LIRLRELVRADHDFSPGVQLQSGAFDNEVSDLCPQPARQYKTSFSQTPQDVLRRLDAVVGRRDPADGFASSRASQDVSELRAPEAILPISIGITISGFKIITGKSVVRLEARANNFVTRIENGCCTKVATKYRADGTRMLEETEKVVDGAKACSATIFDLEGRPKFQNKTEYYPGIAAKKSEVVTEFAGDGSAKKTTVLDFNLSLQEISITTTSVEKIQSTPLDPNRYSVKKTRAEI
jgi:hypothetical protein